MQRVLQRRRRGVGKKSCEEEERAASAEHREKAAREREEKVGMAGEVEKNTFSFLFMSSRLRWIFFSSLLSPRFLINLLSCDFHVVKYQVSCIRNKKKRQARKEKFHPEKYF